MGILNGPIENALGQEQRGAFRVTYYVQASWLPSVLMISQIGQNSNACKLRTTVLLVWLASASSSLAQLEPPRFEAVSVKAVADGTVIRCGAYPCMNLPPVVVDPTRFRAMTEVTGPIGLIEWAYGVRNFQVVGAPEWLTQQKFEVQAVTEGPVAEAQMKKMVQGLLEDQFHLRQHRETRQVPVYALAVNKTSARLNTAKNDLINGGRGDIEVRPGRLFGRGTTMDMLAMILTDNLERPVVNKTGLSGHYDFDITYEPPPATGPGFVPIGASIFVPVQDLGLKLESSRDAIEVLVIDSIDRPAAN
jgi:uncharacterized protein (TIGR03435 family)